MGFNGLPLRSPLLTPFVKVKPRHLVVQKDPLPIKAFVHFKEITKGTAGAISLFCKLALFVLAIVFRFAHAQRWQRDTEKSTSHTLVGVVSRGKSKGRQAYWAAAPSHLEPGGGPIFEQAFKEVEDTLGLSAPLPYIMPDFDLVGGVLSAHSQVKACRMGYAKFLK